MCRQGGVVEAGRVAMQRLLAQALRGHAYADADAVRTGPANLVAGLAQVERVDLPGHTATACGCVVDLLQRQAADHVAVLDLGADLVDVADDGQAFGGGVVHVSMGTGRVDTDVDRVRARSETEQRTGGRSHLKFSHRHKDLLNVEVHGSHRVGLPLLMVRFFRKYAIIPQ